MKRRVRKFVEGGYGDVSSEDYGMGSQQEMIERNIEENERRRMMEGQTSPIRSPEITKGTTVEEFQEPGTAGFSRAPIKQPAGQAKPATKPATKPTTSKPVAAKPETKPTEKPMGRTAMGKTAEMEMAAIEAGRKSKGKSEFERIKDYDKPLERMYPEAMLIGGPMLRGAKVADKAVSQAAKPRVEPRVPQEAMKALTTLPKKGELATRSASDVATKSGELATKGGALATRKPSAAQIESPKARLPYEKNMGPVELAAAKNKRRLLQGESSGKDAIKVQPRPSQRYNKKEDVDFDDIRMGSDFMRAGGKVGSASKRADGIATKGKTRGRYI